jgi:hypothetical protein
MVPPVLAPFAALPALVAAAALSAAPALHAESQPPAQPGPYGDELEFEEDEPGRLRLAAWGGTLLDVDDGPNVPFAGGQLSWAFPSVDLGVLAAAYRFGEERAGREWGPVILARIDRRFQARPGVEALLGFGAGAARERDWGAWFQLAFGFRLTLGPAFVGGELGFEEEQLFRLGATVGVAVF